MVGRDWKRGHTARCAANEEETWLRPWQYHLWMFFSAAPGVMNAARFATSWHGRGQILWIPTSGWSLRLMECQPTEIRPFPSHTYMLPPSRHRRTGIKLSESDNQGRLLASGNSKMCDVGSFTCQKNKSVKVLWDGTYGFSSLSEKTRKSNHLQMSLQRQHFLLSYLKTLSVGPAGVWPATCR